jgi:hypothetical protein
MGNILSRGRQGIMMTEVVFGSMIGLEAIGRKTEIVKVVLLRAIYLECLWLYLMMALLSPVEVPVMAQTTELYVCLKKTVTLQIYGRNWEVILSDHHPATTLENLCQFQVMVLVSLLVHHVVRLKLETYSSTITYLDRGAKEPIGSARMSMIFLVNLSHYPALGLDSLWGLPGIPGPIGNTLAHMRATCGCLKTNLALGLKSALTFWEKVLQITVVYRCRCQVTERV